MSALPVGRIAGLQVGQPQKLVTSAGRDWRSAIFKQPVSGRVRLQGENFAGDYQANRKYHGGPDKAVCVYSVEHYVDLRRELDRPFTAGAFGENLTVVGLTEDRVCIGDTLAIGEVRIQVSQPRQPCANISKRWEVPRLPRLMETTGWTGFYCRLLAAGDVGADDAIAVVERPYPEWTIQRANATLYAADSDREASEALRQTPLLSAEWRRILRRQLDSDES
jgi:MOSC domain-containing protein YiiM